MSGNRLRVLIAGGGTGGHIIPALAVARKLVEDDAAEVRFVGTSRGLETRLVPAAGFPLDLIQVGQFNGVSLATKAITAAKLPVGVTRCVGLLQRFGPHVVFGVGGYASGPAMIAAVLTGTRRVAFEPNAIPGMVNRMMGHWVQAAAVNFADTLRYFRNAQVTGIPVREDFFAIPPRDPFAAPHLLVFGGSQGARVLNRTLPRIAARLLETIPGLTILHQCGARHQESTERDYAQAGASRDRLRVAMFLDDMPQRFAAASLVLCRSGASTVAELAAAGKPSLLVPFPQAADDHQRRNAEVLAKAGAAAMLLEADLTPERLLHELVALFSDSDKLRSIGEKARVLAHADATDAIVRILQAQQRA